MFNHISNTQYLADIIKAYVLNTKATGKAKQSVLKSINHFEGFGWSPGLMQQAHEETESQLTLTDTGITYAIDYPTAFDDITNLLNRYIGFCTPQAKESE